MKRVIPVLVTLVFITFAFTFGLSEHAGASRISNQNLVMRITSLTCAMFSLCATIVMIYFIMVDIKHDR